MTRLMTFNIRTSLAIGDLHHHWNFRRTAVLAAIRDAQADVVGLQEVRPKPLVQITENLSDYARVAAGRNVDNKGEACPLFIGSGLTLDRSETRWLSDTPSTPGSKFPDTQKPRICTIAYVTNHASGSNFALVNTHIDSQFRNIRERSLTLIAQWAHADSVPWVIMGDFNCRIDAPEMNPLLSGGWRDALESIAIEGPHSATFNGFKRRTDGPRIDHVLVPATATVAKAFIANETEGRIPSDHWPVVVDLTWT